MDKYALKGALGLAAASLLLAQPARADMACWGPQQAAAAKVRDLQSKLMVATMRCKAMGFDVLTAYNDFVRTNRATIQAANGVIKAQFDSGFGKDGETYYDRFTTALANEYGAEPTDDAVCEATAGVAAEAAAAEGDIPTLLDLADRLGPTPSLPGGECPISFALGE
jgi:hypothetical protein